MHSSEPGFRFPVADSSRYGSGTACICESPMVWRSLLELALDCKADNLTQLPIVTRVDVSFNVIAL